MNRRSAVRTAIAALALVVLAGCIVNLSFDLKQGVAVKTTAPQTDLTATAPIDLASSREITEHRKDIRSIDLDSVQVVVARVNSTTATTLTGTLVLQAPGGGSEVPVGPRGAIDRLPLIEGQSITIRGTPELDAFLMQQLQSPSGTFNAVLREATVDGATDVQIDFDLHISIGYESGIL